MSGTFELSGVAARRTADALRGRLPADAPVAAIVLGSGLGALADHLDEAVRIPFAEIPGFPSVTVAGHAGALIAGRLAGKRVLCLAGRFHMYEGHSAALAGFPVRVLHALGARTLFVSNAAGGLNRAFAAGDLMRITDQINLTGTSPLVGPAQPGESRFPDMTQAYDPALGAILEEVAAEQGLTLRQGVYVGCLGPAYETPAEVRMLVTLGADATGMSTVSEVIVARVLGMRVAGVSLISNAAAGYTGEPLSHEEVVAAGKEASGRFCALVEGWVARL